MNLSPDKQREMLRHTLTVRHLEERAFADYHVCKICGSVHCYTDGGALHASYWIASRAVLGMLSRESSHQLGLKYQRTRCRLLVRLAS